MKLFTSLIILILFQSCSFDTKSGIWKNENLITDDKNELFQGFETLTSSNKSLNRSIPIDQNFDFNLSIPVSNLLWKDIYYNGSNNLNNFKYNDLNQLSIKSKKLTKFKTSPFKLFEEGNLIINDVRGNIIVYSTNTNKIISKFNFYKKNYKKIKKNINFTVDNKIIYISDNIGYLYAFNYIKNKLVWAKNYKIPFRSNIKLIGDKLVASNQNNNLIFFDKKNGNILNSLPTEETTIKNKFINNISSDNKSLFFLNTYGSIYSVDIEQMKINWFLNLNQSLDINPSSLFSANEIINSKNKIVISAKEFTYILNAKTGSIMHKKNFSSKIKPLIIDDYLFMITKKNLLVATNLNDGNIIYSYDINQKISDFLKIRKSEVEFKNIMMINGEIYIFLRNSYLLKFNVNGKLKHVIKLKSKIYTHPILIDESILYLNFKNKYVKID